MAHASPGDSRYIALTTYRRSGFPVTTPVWAAPLQGKLYVVTADERRQGQAGARHRPSALRSVHHERSPHPGRLAGGHGTHR